MVSIAKRFTTKMSTFKNSNVIDGLPKQFVTSLRILFDILDEERTGYVRLRDIETRWHEEGVKGLPSGVIDSLRKVAPKNGKLDFDNFVTGLKLSLIKPTTSQHVQQGGNSGGKLHKSSSGFQGKDRPVSAPIHGRSRNQQTRNVPNQNDLQQYNPPTNQTHPGTKHVNQNMAAVQPNNFVQSQNIELRNQIYHREQMQQASMKKHPIGEPPSYHSHERKHSNRSQPLHSKPQNDSIKKRHGTEREHVIQRPKSTPIMTRRDDFNTHRHSAEYPLGRVERSPTHDIPHGRPERPPPYRPRHDSPPSIPPRNTHGQIMNELKNWQRENSTERTRPGMHSTNSDSKLVDKNRDEIYVNIEQFRKHVASSNNPKSGVPVSTNPAQKSSVRRQNSRRHTLSSGIDYNVIRRMKQLEQEKDTLLQGLEVVDRTRDWYLKQISLVTEKQNYVEKTSCSDVTLQSNQERLDFVQGRITEVNLNLKSLMESTESNFPAHMNLAVRSPLYSDDSKTRWLKDQNKQLTKEVGDKSDMISKLEKEKATLIRDLFEARSKHKTNYDDTTFM